MRFTVYSLGMSLALLAISSCHTTLPRVDVDASMATLSELQGDWVGTYSSNDTGRHGSIALLLTSRPDSAFGDVLMEPKDHEWGRHDPTYADLRSNHPERIRISFVRIANGLVSGLLAPYAEPDCGCELTTVFQGKIDGNTMSGTFTSRHSGSGKVDEGVWSCRRR